MAFFAQQFQIRESEVIYVRSLSKNTPAFGRITRLAKTNFSVRMEIGVI